MKTKCCNTTHVISIGENFICTNEGCENYLGITAREFDYHKLKIVFAVSVFTFYLLFSFDDFSKTNKGYDVLLIKEPVNHELPLTTDNLQKELESQNVLCSNEVFAQLKLESANLTSSLLQRTNNLSGMRYPFSRKTTACGMYIPDMDTIVFGNKTQLMKYRKTKNYAVYECWTDAVADYRLWQEKCFNVTERYLDFLGKNYAEDSLYVQKIKQSALLE